MHDARHPDRRRADLARILDVEPRPSRLLAPFIYVSLMFLVAAGLLLEAAKTRDDVRAIRRAVELHRPCRR